MTLSLVLADVYLGCLTLSSIYTHFNTLKKKAVGKHCAKMSNFTFFHNVFHAICILKSFHPFPNKPCISRVCSTSLLKTLWEKDKLLMRSSFFPFLTVFSTLLESFLPFSPNLNLSSANSTSLEQSKHLSFGKGLIATFQLSSAASLNLGQSQKTNREWVK